MPNINVGDKSPIEIAVKHYCHAVLINKDVDAASILAELIEELLESEQSISKTAITTNRLSGLSFTSEK